MTITPYLRAFAAGASCGLRTGTAPAIVALGGRKRTFGTIVSTLVVGGELIGDKLPQTPSRLQVPGLSSRVIAGAWCGWTLAKRADANAIAGAIVGATAAPAAAWLGFTIRQDLTVERDRSDFPIALIEDALAVGLALAATAGSARA